MENFNSDDRRDDFEEVSENVENQDSESQESNEQNLGMDFYEESFKAMEEGALLKGTVVQVGKEYVMLDVAGKSEGRIALQEFTDADGNLTVKIGDKVEALLVRADDDDGYINDASVDAMLARPTAPFEFGGRIRYWRFSSPSPQSLSSYATSLHWRI